MDFKNKLIGLTAFIVIFLSYNYLQPMGSGFNVISKNGYTLQTHEINKDNKWSTFRVEKNGNFFIHPGEKKAVRGVFTFEEDGKAALNLSIRRGSVVGNIEFTIIKNNKEFDRSIVTARETNQVILEIKRGDTIEVIAEKHGRTAGDWGNLQVSLQDTAFKYKDFLIPFLWSILFIFLFGKKHSYIAMNSYFIFTLILVAEKLNFGILSFNSILTYMLLLFSMTFIFTFVYQELTSLKKYKIASILSFTIALVVYVIPLFFIIYALNFDDTISKDILYAVYQSNSSESYEYISDFISIRYILFFFCVTGLIAFLLIKQESRETLKIEKSLMMFIVITFLSISLAQFSQLRIPTSVVESFEKYNEELRLFQDIQDKRKTGEIKFSASKKASGETYVIVIGESLSKKHMGIYGYFRDTTPLLSKMNQQSELLVFNNAYSNHTHTVPVLSLSLTEANQYNKKTYYDSLSIVEILNKANIETSWLTNQILYSSWDNLVSVIASSSNNLVALNTSVGEHSRTQKHDGALISEVKKVLAKKTDKNRVIFIHLMGSHSNYSSRYPKEKYSIYQGKLEQGEFGTNASKNPLINPYDNSVVYNDYVISSILGELQQEKGVNGLIYMSDHADDIERGLGHNSGKYTYEMSQIPMIAWFSKEYKKKYSNKYNNLLNSTNKLYSNDMFYNTLIGIFDVQTDKYNSKYDLASNNYNLNPQDALVLHGKKHYIDKNNYIYLQKMNAKYLIDSNQSSRVFPHRVDSVGKLQDIWNDGFRSFEVDTRFGDNNSTVFQVGHNPGVMGIKLEEFLSKVDYRHIQRVWLDFKNLDKNNYKKALERLQYLNNKFNIKNKFIIESGTTIEFFEEFKQDGWHTSYYLPTNTIVKLLKNNDIKEMNKLATKIAKQAVTQGLSAVSFDFRLYPFVKNYLEPKISDQIVYHIWYAPSLYDVNFKDALLNYKLYLDDRVKTLLTVYESQYNL